MEISTPEVVDLVCRDFDITIDSENEEERINILRQVLADRLAELLDRNRALFFSTLYRIDVDEKKVMAALAGPPDQISRNLADLVLQRQVQKIQTRRRYRQTGEI